MVVTALGGATIRCAALLLKADLILCTAQTTARHKGTGTQTVLAACFTISAYSTLAVASVRATRLAGTIGNTRAFTRRLAPTGAIPNITDFPAVSAAAVDRFSVTPRCILVIFAG